MEIPRGRRGLAHLSSWEQECCGAALRVGETAAVVLQAAREGEADLRGASVDWLLVLHDDDGPGLPPSRRALVRVERVQELRLQWQQVSADGQAPVPSPRGLIDGDSGPGSRRVRARPPSPSTDRSTPILWDRGASGTFVREGGLEPPRPLGHTDLNRARLPIPPLALVVRSDSRPCGQRRIAYPSPCSRANPGWRRLRWTWGCRAAGCRSPGSPRP